MTTYQPNENEMLIEVVQRMVLKAEESREVVFAEFNGVNLKARFGKDKNTEMLRILENYKIELSRRRRKCFAFSKEESHISRIEMIKEDLYYEVSTLMIELHKLDFLDLKTVILWLERLQEVSAYEEVILPVSEILHSFRKNGYFPNENPKNESYKKDEEAYARWVIGQALGDLEYCGKIHQIIRLFTTAWKTKFDYV